MNKLVAYLKIKFHIWRAEKLIAKRFRLLAEAQQKVDESTQLATAIEEHTVRAREILDTVLQELKK